MSGFGDPDHEPIEQPGAQMEQQNAEEVDYNLEDLWKRLEEQYPEHYQWSQDNVQLYQEGLAKLERGEPLGQTQLQASNSGSHRSCQVDQTSNPCLLISSKRKRENDVYDLCSSHQSRALRMGGQPQQQHVSEQSAAYENAPTNEPTEASSHRSRQVQKSNPDLPLPLTGSNHNNEYNLLNQCSQQSRALRMGSQPQQQHVSQQSAAYENAPTDASHRSRQVQTLNPDPLLPWSLPIPLPLTGSNRNCEYDLNNQRLLQKYEAYLQAQAEARSQQSGALVMGTQPQHQPIFHRKGNGQGVSLGRQSQLQQQSTFSANQHPVTPYSSTQIQGGSSSNAQTELNLSRNPQILNTTAYSHNSFPVNQRPVSSNSSAQIPQNLLQASSSNAQNVIPENDDSSGQGGQAS